MLENGQGMIRVFYLTCIECGCLVYFDVNSEEELYREFEIQDDDFEVDGDPFEDRLEREWLEE
jgi:hypothetical protein